jgi:ABC-type multidrug transport system permease subunit
MQVSMMCYLMFGYQNDFGKFLIFAVCILLTLVIAESLGMMFAMVSPTGDVAIVFASIVFIVLLSVTGFLTSSMPKHYEWLQHASFLRCAHQNV